MARSGWLNLLYRATLTLPAHLRPNAVAANFAATLGELAGSYRESTSVR